MDSVTKRCLNCGWHVKEDEISDSFFREVTRNSAELTVTERIWRMITNIVIEIAKCFEIVDEKILETLYQPFGYTSAFYTD